MDDVKSAGDFVTVGSVKMPRSDFYAMVEKADRKENISILLWFVWAFLFGGLMVWGINNESDVFSIVFTILMIVSVIVTQKVLTSDLRKLEKSNPEDVLEWGLEKARREGLTKRARAEDLARRSMRNHDAVRENVVDDTDVDSVTIGDNVIIDGGDDIVAVVNC